MKTCRIIAIVAALCLSSSFVLAAGSDWITKFGDAERTGRTSTNLNFQKNRIAQIFRYTLPEGEKTSLNPPVFANGKAYFTSDITKDETTLGSKLYCVDAEKGTSIFSKDLGAKGASSVTYFDGKLYLCTIDKPSFLCLDATNGNKVWQIQTSGVYPKFSPLAYDGMIFFCSYNNNVYAYNAKTGKPHWTFTAEGPIKTSPCASNGKLMFGADDWKVY